MMAEEHIRENAPDVSTNEQTQGIAARLADSYGQASSRAPGYPISSNLSALKTWLSQAHAYFRNSSREELTLTYASEWVLDNYYIIRQALQQIDKDLPPRYYAQLPKLTLGPFAGYPRIYAITREILDHQNLLVDLEDLQSILILVQERVPLTMGELWAVPIFLRVGLVEALSSALVQILANKIQPETPVSLPPTGLVAGERAGTISEKGAEQAGASSSETNVIANTILSLRSISEQDWNDFFDSVSLVERMLGEDPVGVYSRMDFKSRDLYRKEIEKLAFATGREETVLAGIVLELARAGQHANGREGPLADRLSHLGYYLIAGGRPALEARIGYRPQGTAALRRWIFQNAGWLYLGSILALTLLLIFLCLLPVLAWTFHPLAKVAVGLLLLVPAITIATSLINWLVTLLVPPRILPKISFRDEIPDPFRTLVVIPALITSKDEVDSLVRQVEMHYMRNPEPGLLFALLTDFGDSAQETQPEDEELVRRAADGIRALNALYPRSDGEQPFFFLHRPRVWNPREGAWIGWERKRGKLHELNQLLMGKGTGDAFAERVGDLRLLNGVHFVITLDADTVLPRGAARRLAGTLAHPLNRALFGDDRQVVAGYTVLQPRMEIGPVSANQSWFTRIFAGDAGLDLYTLAVSDTYQDLFGEGSYVGKGIYDVAAFERSVDSRIPENMLLSHDLLEGIMGRAGLVTDITMVEDYPPSYFAQATRQRRWIRGDWQLLPWLLFPGKFGVRFSAVDRWKIMDNLRRSLLAPALVLLFVLGSLWLPGSHWLWTALLLLTLGVPLLTSLARGAQQTVSGEEMTVAFRPASLEFTRWLLAVAFLPYEAYEATDAILTTLYRLIISRRNLLQWTTAAHMARLLRTEKRNMAWEKMGAASFLALLIAVAILLIDPPALWTAAPVLLLWLASPVLVRWIDQPLPKNVTTQLTREQASQLRSIARRTWSFFERYVGPEDHWLPPDHFQESPLGIVAHRTSPTNIGLLLNATLAAYDLGYLDPLSLSTRLAATVESLEQLERYRGHFINWYDTLTLQPLHPRYVSTVDSGNLAASLIVTARACKAMRDTHVFRWELWQGYLDVLSILLETLAGLGKARTASRIIPRGGDARTSVPLGQIREIEQKIEAMSAEILGAQEEPQRWYGLFQTVSGPFWEDISGRLGKLIATGRSVFNLESLRGLQEVAAQVGRYHAAVQRTIRELVPWIPLFENQPVLLRSPLVQTQMVELRKILPYSPELGRITSHVESALGQIASLREALKAEPEPKAKVASNFPENPGETQAHPASNIAVEGVSDEEAARSWLDALEQAITHGSAAAEALLDSYAQIEAKAEQYVCEMDFRFLYNPLRRLFHIGYNLDAGQLDHNYYDLLASEARITSLVAIALGEVPQSHWLHLSRPVTEINGMRVLLSWSATMFEYLMPPLFLPLYPGTLLTESAYGAVRRQIDYGKSKEVPWGISESGFYRFDANMNYQYRAFGVPGLGFKRGLEDDLVIAPYASLMAVGYDPQAVVDNIASLIRHGGMGLWGFYEAIDFTADHLLYGETSAIVREYMAHHQGMILLALDNFFHDNVMVQRMIGDPYICSVDLLLQEQVPLAVPVQSPFAEGVKGIQRVAVSEAETIQPWTVPVQTPIPQVNLLSNGNYSVIISNSGSGYSSWQDTDLTRWQPDGVLDPWGTWIYLQDLDVKEEKESQDALWSAGFQPVPGSPNETQVTFFAHMAVFRRNQNGVVATMEATVAPDDPVEIRRVNINNSGDRPRHLRVTSYGEVILNQQSADARHPAFNKLFIEEEWVPDLNLQIFRRRPRAETEKPVYLGHLLLAGEFLTPTKAHEADRERFMGRDGSPRRPAELLTGSYLSGTSGATLDPIFALGQELRLGPHQTVQLAYVTIAGESREDLITLAERYRNWNWVERSFHQADLAAQAWLSQHAINTQALKETSQVLSALLYPFPAERARTDILSANRLGQSGLWRFGISGDYPILLVQLDDPAQLDLVREVLQIHRYLRSRRFMADVVILNQQQTNYGAELNGMLYRLVSRVNSEQWLNQRGGIFILYADQMQEEERVLLKTAARVLLSGAEGSLAEQLPGYSIPVPHLPELAPTREAVPITGLDPASSLLEEAKQDLKFYNGYGGFSADGKEYVITRPAGKPTPAPWVNVIGYPQFGFLVTEAGSQCTWAVNSGENRLSPWSNDPVRDPTGEALYLRDEETGEVWTPTPLPSGEGISFLVRHGAGYTVFESESHGLRQRLTLFASPEDPVKLVHLEVQNTWAHIRRVTATQYIDWVLGTTHYNSQPYLIPEYDAERECLLVRNPYNTEFAERVAFLAASKKVHGVTADRTEFLGRNGTLAQPAAFKRLGLETRITAGEDTCGVLQVHIDLQPGESEEIYFILGQGDHRDHALALVEKYHQEGRIGDAWERTRVFWDRLLEAVQVKTPDPAVDLILNRWLLYQALSCRIWGRTAFYQSSGAFGFRDQLQDVLALLPIDPAISRGQILNSASHQFEEGDVLHWWHPPSGRGVRTRISDDLLWLPFVTALYVESTADDRILGEKIPFLLAPPLQPGEDERYGLYPSTTEGFTLFEHCRRAIERGSTIGPHGLPLIGTGDWNDGLNRVGVEGKGESVWLAWFLCDVLTRFASLCERMRGVPDLKALEIPEKLEDVYRARAKDYAAAVEKSAWDGDWYRRAYYDDGATLGSKEDPECNIDGIAQSWAVISGAGDGERSKRAMQSTLEKLVQPENRLLLLFTPPFDQTPRDPGYIKGYLPGTRENGGQYTHAATWTAWAYTRMEDGEQAGALFQLLNPIYQSNGEEMANAYRVEPYVICADIYSVEPYLRRGGWTWYTGSAAWMYRLGHEAILGFHKIGETLRIAPVIPSGWEGFEIRYRYKDTVYDIQVKNPEHGTPAVQQVSVDGNQIENGSIPLVNDQREHRVVVILGIG